MESIVEHKGYQGIVNVDLKNSIVYGKIEDINDLVTFEADSLQEVEKVFKETVEDYLETCKELGKDPDKAYKGQFNIRLGAMLHRQAARVARRKRVSLNDYIKTTIAKDLETDGSIA